MIQQSKKGNLYYLIAFAAIIVLGWYAGGCRKDDFNTNPDFRLSFSSDTVMFDTVFTTLGSATRQFLIRNSGNQKINISTISLSGGQQSSFRINVDGNSGFIFHNIEIGAHDSAFVFAKVTIDPNQQSQPLVQTDSVLFTINGKIQKVLLVAWGQDAYFHNNVTLKGNVEFSADKPHVIYGNLTLDTSAVLQIQPGTQLCFHQDSYLVALAGSRIVSEGRLEKPILFRSDATVIFHPEKDTVPGQWGGIKLKAMSGNHSFINSSILNAKIAIEADSCVSANAITLYNCKISNMVNYGLKLQNTTLRAANCEFSNCGGYLLQIIGGHGYDFRQCTFANYWPFTARKVPSLSISNYYFTEDKNKVLTTLQNVYFGNCIIDSYYGEELETKIDAPTPFELFFENCLISSQLDKTHAELFSNCQFNKEIKFEAVQKLNFQLDTLSAAKDFGAMSVIQSSILNLHTDIKGNPRDADLGPDAGAYERIEKR